MPCAAGPTMSAAVMVPEAVPEVAWVQAGFPPPPHRYTITPPLTLVGPKWMWLNRGRVVRPLHCSV